MLWKAVVLEVISFFLTELFHPFLLVLNHTSTSLTNCFVYSFEWEIVRSLMN